MVEVSSFLDAASKWSGIAAVVISIGGVVYGYGFQGGQIGPLGDRVRSLEAKLDKMASDIVEIRQQMSVFDSKMGGTTTTLADNFKSLEAKLASAVSNIDYLGKEMNLLDSRTTQNTSALGEAYKKFTAVNLLMERCLDLSKQLESGVRQTSMGWSQIDRQATEENMKVLNCNLVFHLP